MLKLAGILCIVLSCAGLGRIRGSTLNKRKQLLRGCHQGILALMREIDFATPMSRALLSAASAAGRAESLFRKAASLLEEADGMTAGEAWRNSVEQAYLPTEDTALLLLLGDGLGLSDHAGQMRSLEMMRLRLKDAEKAAEEDLSRFGRVWRVMGWSCGAILALLLV